MKTLDYIFYKIYRTLQKTEYADISVFVAAGFTSVLITLNLMTLTDFFRNMHIIQFTYHLIMGAVISAIFLIFSLIYFLTNKRYARIISKYSLETEKQRKRGNLIMWIFVVGTFLIEIAEPFLFNPNAHW